MKTQISTPIEFQYTSFKLEAYAGSLETSSELLKQIIQKLNDANLPENLRLIDRFGNRTGSSKRRIIHISSPFEKQGKRCFGRLALIKEKAPKFWGGKDIVEEINKPENREFIEITNYIINFNKSSDPVLMVEFNNSGPRISDIEFFFRQISKYYKLSKSLKSNLHLDIDYKDLDKSLDNVFGLNVKVTNNRLIDLNWLKTLAGLQNESGFKDVRIDIHYERKRDKSGDILKNTKALRYARGIIEWLKKDENNIEAVEDLKLTYQADSNDDILELDFLKNKKTSCLEIPLYNGVYYKRDDFKYHVGLEFNHYLQNGNTNNQCKDS